MWASRLSKSRNTNCNRRSNMLNYKRVLRRPEHWTQDHRCKRGTNGPARLLRTAWVPQDTHGNPRISRGPPWSQRGTLQQFTTPRVPSAQRAAVMLWACCAGALVMTRCFPRCFFAIFLSSSDRYPTSANLTPPD